MKVIVAKLPGGAAVPVNLNEGASVLDAIQAANYASGLEGGFEIRKNDSVVTASEKVAHGDIISLTAKVQGNAKKNYSGLIYVTVANSGVAPVYVRHFPLKAQSFFQPEDENEKLAVQGKILTYVNKDSFNADDYKFAAIKPNQDRPVKFRSLNCGNLFLSPETLLVVCLKDDVISIDNPAKFYEAAVPVTGESTTNECGETACECESEPEEKPKAKKSRKRKAKKTEACKCEAKKDDVCDCEHEVNLDTAGCGETECKCKEELKPLASISVSLPNTSFDDIVKTITKLKKMFGDSEISANIFCDLQI